MYSKLQDVNSGCDQRLRSERNPNSIAADLGNYRKNTHRHQIEAADSEFIPYPYVMARSSGDVFYSLAPRANLNSLLEKEPSINVNTPGLF